MTDRAPIETRNLDRNGDAELPWSHDVLVAASTSTGVTHFLGTTRPDGRSHAAGIGATRWRFER